jgi:glyoxylase-like metal-dependent hydrolase (beta-lactamase superfamily II)
MRVHPWIFAAGVAAVSSAGLAQAQPDPATVTIKIEKAGEGVHMLTGAGGNIGVSVGKDGVFLVDDQYAPLTPKILEALKALDPRAPRFVLNTHWHGDHSGGNENMGQAGALLVAHDNVRLRMTQDHFLAAFNSKVPPAAPGALPVVTYGQDVTFHINGEEVHGFHVPPAHTDGDSIVHFKKANVIHCGDTFFNGMYPFIDTTTGGNIDGMIAAADKVLAMAGPATKIIPGHGPMASKADLQAYRDMLAGVRSAVKPLVDAGRTIDQIKAAKPLAPFDAKWGGGFLKADVFVGIVAEGMSKKKN